MSGRWAGRDVTGVGAFTCTSHSCFIPRGMVDYNKGERYIYTDYAFASAARYLYERGRIDIFMTYDVWCHWFLRFLQHRAPKLPPHIALPVGLVLSGAIPKWHIIGHQLSCWIRYSLDHMQHVGRLEGEGPERVWAHMNEHSGSTSEQGPGMRTDSINNMAYEWNYEKMIGLAKALPPKFEEAKVMLAKQKGVHEELTSSLLAAKIKQWETESIEPTQVNGTWTSPLADPILNYGKFQSSIKDAREEESPTARAAGKRPGATRWLSEGIELEHSIRKLQDKAKEFGTHPTPKQANAFNAQVSFLRDRLTAHHQQRPKFMPTLGDPDHPEFRPFTDEWTEGFHVVLPSSYAAETLQAAGLTSLIKVELRLRKGMCGDGIESAKRLLGVKDMTISHRNRNLSGEIATTRAQSAIHAHTAKVKKAQWRYENSRKVIIRLGATESDLDLYRELGDEDLQSLKSYLAEVSRGIGQGYTNISWIWRNGVAPNTEDWASEGT
ncbi:hypothetical protein FRC08_003013 [Ceratobasidium sp. 394]|nr:hypothetical protein FRC08_003013 [Ceratobasidium sp. 394]